MPSFKYKCLVANDDPLSLSVLKTMFTKMKFKCSTARNGQEAYEKVKKKMNDLKDMFDLVVLDLNMPIADGYEACTNIKQLF